jgi:thioredoxin reductase (NADPH)
MEYDVVVIGCGPAGLSTGTKLARRGLKVLLVYRDLFGGEVAQLEWVNDFPEPGRRVSGLELAPALASEAEQSGVTFEQATVREIESYSMTNVVTFDDGRVINAAFVVLATGRTERRLGIPGPDRFENRGLIHCPVCDAGLFENRTVAVIGGGMAGALGALHLARHAVCVTVVERGTALSAPNHLIQAIQDNSRIEVLFDTEPTAILGDSHVEAVTMRNRLTNQLSDFPCQGILIRAGYESGLRHIRAGVDVDDNGYAIVGLDMRSSLPGVFAIGDARASSPRTVAAALADADLAATSIMAVVAEA